MAGDRYSSVTVDQNCDEEPETEEDVRLPPLSSPIDDAYDDWWGNISLGDQFDICDTEGYWCEAEVLKIDLENRKIFVAFLYWDSRWDIWVSESENRIAPLHRHTYIEGGSLQVGQRIEALDKTNKWLPSFVIELSEERDEAKVHYKGWHFKFDEWLDRRGNRIRPYGRNKPVVERRRREQKLWRVPGTSCSDQPNQLATNVGSSTFSTKSEQHLMTNNNDTGKTNRDQHKNFASSSPEDMEHRRQISDMSERYNHYIGALNAQPIPLKVVSVPGDGNCLFRSVAHQVYGDYELHNLVRQRCMDYMEADAGFYSQFVEGGMEAFPFYLRAKRLNACWGDDPEIQSICELYNRPAEIWAYDTQRGARKLRTFHEATGRLSAQLPLRLSYYGGGHYDSIVDAKHSDQLLLSVPGVAESLALSRVAERVALASSTSSIVNIARVNGSQASEEAALDLAMQMSRNDENRFSWQDDIETCLSMSLEESYLKNNKMSQSSDEYVTKKISGDDNCAKKSVAFAEHSLESNDLNGVKEESLEMEISSSSSSFSSVLSPIGIDMNIKNDNDNDNNAVSIAIQSDTLRIAVEESERDYIDSAMLSSLQDETQNMEEEMLRQVRLESLLESQAADARMMADTYGFDNESKMSSILNISAYEYENSNRDRNGAIDEAQGEGDGKGKEFDYNIETPSEVDLILKLSELSEEEALQLALKESASTSSLYSTAVRPNMYEYGSYGLRSPRSPYFELGGRGAHTGLAPVVLGLEQCVGGDGQSQSQANIDGQGHMKTESETLQDAMRLYMKSVTSSTYPLANPQNANNNSTTTTTSSSSSSSSSSSTIGNSRETVADGDVLSSIGNRNGTSYGNEIRRTQAEEDEEEDEERELQRAIAESLK